MKVNLNQFYFITTYLTKDYYSKHYITSRIPFEEKLLKILTEQVENIFMVNKTDEPVTCC